MAYRLSPNEPVFAGLRRIARAELERAAGLLTTARGGERATAVHEARKSIKKTRAILRLIGTGSGAAVGGAVAREDARLRDIARMLSEYRDTGVALETFDALRRKFQDSLRRGALLSIRRGLLARQRETMRRPGTGAVLQAAGELLRQRADGVEDWALTGSAAPGAAADDLASMEAGLARTFRCGRKALARLRREPTAANFHEWRKRVKDHWYHVRLLDGLWPDVQRGYAQQLAELETGLGDDQNLSVLRETLAKRPGAFGAAQDLELFYALAAARQEELRAQALALGGGIYQDKPRDFMARVRKLWAGLHAASEPLPPAEETAARPSVDVTPALAESAPPAAKRASTAMATAVHSVAKRGPAAVVPAVPRASKLARSAITLAAHPAAKPASIAVLPAVPSGAAGGSAGGQRAPRAKVSRAPASASRAGKGRARNRPQPKLRRPPPVR
jgi:CHAD domain-containing protein